MIGDRRWAHVLGAAATLAALGLVCLLATASSPREPPAAAPDPLAALGIAVTAGAAAGYVADEICARCHTDLYVSFQEVGMARSFARPQRARRVESYESARFSHPSSGEHYEMLWRGGRLVFRRHQLDAEGEVVNLFEQEVDWILGSGSRSRSYLYQTAGGELFQLPVAWYSQSASWGMAPGYDRPDHQGVLRRVRRECMFCHNAFPEVPADSDGHGAPQSFPAALPEGIGCQRCHGPGAEHVRRAFDPAAARDEIQRAIVNPARLEPRLRDDVCLQCHLQPTVALTSPRRFGRGDYSFRPGEPLPGYLVQLDVLEAAQGEHPAPAERFEINHHAYRLRQSRCFLESGGELSCLTCHDPHVKVPREPAERFQAHYRSACLSCHGGDDCALPPMPAASGEAVPADRCVSCHMPQRRTQDVVQVTMTDHRIARRPGGPELTAPLAESDPRIREVLLYEPARGPTGAEAGLYRAVAMARAGSGAGLGRLERLLAAPPPGLPVDQPEPWLDLAGGHLAAGRFADAEKAARRALGLRPGSALGHEHLGLALAGRGRWGEAAEELRRALAAAPGRAEAHFNLGKLLARSGRREEAALHLTRALALRANLPAAWLELANLHAGAGRNAEAAAAYRRALAVDPRFGPAYLNLGQTLRRAGDIEEAARVWRHGLTAAPAFREPLEAALRGAKIPASGEGPDASPRREGL